MQVRDNEKCLGCPLRRLQPTAQFVEPKLGDGLRLAIGDRPDAHDVASGEAFTAGVSNWLRGAKGADGKRHGGFYYKAGVKDKDVTFLNVLQCRPPLVNDKDTWPTGPEARAYIAREDGQQAVAHCVREHVVPMLKSRPWERIDIYGDEALLALTHRGEGVYHWRGSPMAVAELGDEMKAIPTLHPRSVAIDQEMIPVVINDLRKSMAQLPEDYNLYPTLEDVQDFTATEFVFDIETPAYREMGDAAPITIVGLCDRPSHVIVVPFSGAYILELKRIFERATNVITQNGCQFDVPRLRRDGVRLGPNCRESDTMLLHHLRFPNLPHDLEFIGSCFSNKPAWKSDKADFNLYCARDCDVTMQAYRQLWPMIQHEKMQDLYEYTQVPLAQICHEMTALGVKQDPSRLTEVRTKFLAEIDSHIPKLPPELQPFQQAVKRRVLAPAGTLGKSGKPIKYTHIEDFELVKPYRSGALKQKFLYETLTLPVQYKGTQPTVDKTALDKLGGIVRRDKTLEQVRKYEILGWLETLRRLSKCETLVSGFLKEDASGKSRTIHPSFNPHGTSTGRLSSSHPNFQNQPETARYLYVPRHADWEWASVDFSGIENRIMALDAHDTARLERMNTGVNEHKYATELFYQIPYAEVVKDNDPDAPYNKAKHIVHGTDRGMGAKKISMMYGVDFGEAKRLQDLWKQAISKTVEYQSVVAARAKREGYLVNPFGRRGWFYTDRAYTESISFPPQSTGADIIFRCMIALYYERIGWPIEKVMKVAGHVEALPKPANMLISVHDSLEFEYPREMRETVLGVVHRVMTQPWRELAGYSFPVSIAIGSSWGEVEPYILQS